MFSRKDTPVRKVHHEGALQFAFIRAAGTSEAGSTLEGGWDLAVHAGGRCAVPEGSVRSLVYCIPFRLIYAIY